MKWGNSYLNSGLADTKHDPKVGYSRKVTDIFTWLQCFCSFVSVRAQQTPALIPELMAYMATIVRVSQAWHGCSTMQPSASKLL